MKTFKIILGIILDVVFVVIVGLFLTYLNKNLAFGKFIFYALLVATLILIFTYEKNVTTKVFTMVLSLLVPYFGLSFSLLFYLQKLCLKFYKPIKNSKKHNYEIPLNMLKTENENLAKVAQYVDYQTNFPILFCEKICFLGNSNDFLSQIINEINRAKDYVLLEFYIIKYSKDFARLENAIYSAIERGVKVIISCDYFGSGNIKRSPFGKSLINHGCEIFVYKKTGLFLSLSFNVRTHRKIAVMDGKVGFLGGVNFNDEEKIPSKDLGVKLYGDGAKQLENMFYRLFGGVSKYDFSKEKVGEGYILPFSVYGKGTIKQTVISLLMLAKKEVLISTPYFSFDQQIKDVFKYLNAIGVKIKVMLPKNSNKIIKSINLSFAKEMEDYFSEVYLYKEKFLHEKMIVIDNEICFTGSLNFDYRSFNYQIESGLIIGNNRVIDDFILDFNICLASCDRLEKSSSNNFFSLFYEKFLRLFSYFV